MHNRNQEITLTCFSGIWILLLSISVLSPALALGLLGVGVGQTGVFLTLYLKYDRENNPRKVLGEPPLEWVVHIGFLDWRFGRRVEYARLNDQARMCGMQIRSQWPTATPSVSRIVHFAEYAGMYRVPEAL